MRTSILVVDDDPAVRRVYEDHFTTAGFRVRGAATLRDARALLEARVFDAVIVDVSLTRHGHEGLAVADLVLKLSGARPVLVLTAYGQPGYARAAAALRADAFLHKPVSLAWLQRMLLAHIAERADARVVAVPVH